MSRPLRLAIAAGGTSGHIHPALAVSAALRLRDPDSALLFIGTAHGLEGRVVPRAGFAFRSIRASGFPNRISLAAFKAISDLIAGRREALRVLRDFRPDVVLGTGGYVCGPVVFAANRLRIPVVLHEQNAYPGRANRLLSRKARFVCVSFQDSGMNFSKGVATLQTGYPVRPVFFSTDRDEARHALGIPDEIPFVLALGGSQGARSINRAVTAMLLEGPAPSGCRILLSTGDGLFDEAKRESESLRTRSDEFRLVSYLEEPHVAMAAADLIVCRAGAGACAEIAALGKPSILVPYPFAANDHQTFNARSLTDIGAAVLCADADFDGPALRHLLEEILPDRGRRLRMAASAKRLAREDAADRIVDCLLQAAGKGDPS